MTFVSCPPEHLLTIPPPNCPHGPTILFQDQNYYYYACSASREHEFCPFELSAQKWKRLFQKNDNKLKNENKSYQIPYQYLLNDPNPIEFCQDCNLIVIHSESNEIMPQHRRSNHRKCSNKIPFKSKSPVNLLRLKTQNENFAQYFFSMETIDFVIDHIVERLEYEKVICIGCPTLHEKLISKPRISSILLDLDGRYRQFYDKNNFVLFNMFNCHFLETDGEKCFQNFLSQTTSWKKVLILIDPPFGGLIECLGDSLKILVEKYFNDDSNQIDLVLFFPYFNEHWIRKSFDRISITDFIVTYENHSKYRECKSPVRIFTNVDLGNFVHFKPVRYDWCQKCHRTIFKNNRHCRECDECPGRDATKQLKHCFQCNRCEKITNVHCAKCNRCHSKDKCQNTKKTRKK